MPLVKIDIIKGTRSPTEIRKMADVIQQTLLDHFSAPERDRYQVRMQSFTSHFPVDDI
jgi:phenylpyruvate tautomerase PptA (4-oxalocrotonate tautomerase family)